MANGIIDKNQSDVCTNHNNTVDSVCLTHRLCTCDTYKSGSKTNKSSSGLAGNCRSHNEYSYVYGETYESSKSSTRSDISCYSFNSVNITNCKSHSNNCYPYGSNGANEIQIDCSGHRTVNENSQLTFASYAAGDIIDNEQFINLQNSIRDEITQRKSHAAYSLLGSYSDQNVKNETIIDDSSPNNINSILEQIRNRVKSLNDYASYPLNRYSTIDNSTIINASNIKNLESDINDSWTDCVCYSDCTGYGAWFYKNCTCNVNCKCNY